MLPFPRLDFNYIMFQVAQTGVKYIMVKIAQTNFKLMYSQVFSGIQTLNWIHCNTSG